MKIEFIYSSNNKNINDIRKNLLQAFFKAKLPAKWTEWKTTDSNCPKYAKLLTLPTVLINGKIIESESSSLFMEDIKIAFIAQKKVNKSNKFSWNKLLSIVTSIFPALVAKLTCPLCLSVYIAILGAFGVTISSADLLLIPLTSFFLLITLAMLAFRAKNRRGYRPLYLGLIASVIILIGYFIFLNEISLYVGGVLIIVASIWNSLPKKQNKLCNSCK